MCSYSFERTMGTIEKEFMATTYIWTFGVFSDLRSSLLIQFIAGDSLCLRCAGLDFSGGGLC